MDASRSGGRALRGNGGDGVDRIDRHGTIDQSKSHVSKRKRGEAVLRGELEHTLHVIWQLAMSETEIMFHRAPTSFADEETEPMATLLEARTRSRGLGRSMTIRFTGRLQRRAN